MSDTYIYIYIFKCIYSSIEINYIPDKSFGWNIGHIPFKFF